MHVEIRRVRPRDAGALEAVRLTALLDAPSAFGSTYEQEAGLSRDDWLHRARRSSAGHDAATFLAWADGVAIGIVGAHRSAETPTDVELVSMWTAPTVRRSGVARRLVGAVVEWAATAPTDSISLWVTHGNVAARALYESMGFLPTDEHQPLPSDPCRTEIRMRLVTDS